MRNLGGDGLFTAYTQEPNWGKAHRLLMPAFGPIAIRKMLPQMLDIAEQMLLKLERMGNEQVFDVAEEMTKLTLDTIALCSFDYRFNSFYSDELHPFVHAMVDGLAESGKRAVRLPFQQKLNDDTQIIINKNKSVNFHLPTGYPVSLMDILSNYVELAQPVTKKQLKILGNACPCPPEKMEILNMAERDYYLQHVLPKRISLLDVLEKYLSIDLELGTFLELLPPLKPRQYSISSSPLSNPNCLSLTVSVVNAPAWSGLGNFEGVASNYLAYLRPDSKIRSITQPASTAFRPPKDTTIPMILVCAGSGLAPFRGFIQERALQKEKGMPIGEILLFFGCDHPDVDFLYKGEIKDWEAKGVLKTYLAFSEKVEDEVKFVQHRLWKERVEVFNLFQQQARFFVCGDGKYMAPAVKATFLKIYQELANKTKAEAQEWFATIEKEGIRYVTDIFI